MSISWGGLENWLIDQKIAFNEIVFKNFWNSIHGITVQTCRSRVMWWASRSGCIVFDLNLCGGHAICLHILLKFPILVMES